MKEVKNSLEEKIETISQKFIEEIKNKDVQIISHFDTDGITSATIMIKTLQRLDQKFSIKIFKSLEKELIEKLPKNRITIFLDLGSNNLEQISKAGFKKTFIIDHHEITQKVPPEIEIINSELHEKQKISASGLTYLFCKKINPKNKDLAKLAVLGMVGDMLEKEKNKFNDEIIKDSDIIIKKGLPMYPATRPLNRVIEYCSRPYIPGVTGNSRGTFELLREAGLTLENKRYKCLTDLTKEEMKKLITAIMLRSPNSKNEDIVGNFFLIKFYNRLEDAREMSAKVNACSRLGEMETAIQFCMEMPNIRKKVDQIHAKYKQNIVSGLKFVSEEKQIKGKDFIIINAKAKIKDTIIGTISSILSTSSLYEEGTIIVGMAYRKKYIKISARVVGRKKRNIREILDNVIKIVGGEVGGHQAAAGALITKEKEQEFINCLKKHLEVEVIKI